MRFVSSPVIEAFLLQTCSLLLDKVTPWKLRGENVPSQQQEIVSCNAIVVSGAFRRKCGKLCILKVILISEEIESENNHWFMVSVDVYRFVEFFDPENREDDATLHSFVS